VWLAHRSSPGLKLAQMVAQPIRELRINPDYPDFVKVSHAFTEGTARIYRFTFTVGHVAFMVYGHNVPAEVDVTDAPISAQFSQRIWPSQSHITWPTARSIDEIGGYRGWHEKWQGSQPLPEMPPPQLTPRPPNRKARRAAERAKRPR